MKTPSFSIHSETVPGALVISLCTPDGIKHVLISSIQGIDSEDKLIAMIVERAKAFVPSLTTLTL